MPCFVGSILKTERVLSPSSLGEGESLDMTIDMMMSITTAASSRMYGEVDRLLL
jgi:hypothetical protein